MTTTIPTPFCGDLYCPDFDYGATDCAVCVADPAEAADPDTPPTAYQKAAAELRRIADALDALPADLDHDPQVSVTVRPYSLFFPESRSRVGVSEATACAAVDVLAAAVVGVPATVREHAAGYRYYGASTPTTTPVWLDTGAYLADPDTPETLRAEVARLRAELAASRTTGDTDPADAPESSTPRAGSPHAISPLGE